MIGVFEFFLLGGIFALGFYVFYSVMKTIENVLKAWVEKRRLVKSIKKLVETLKGLQEVLAKIEPADKKGKQVKKKK